MVRRNFRHLDIDDFRLIYKTYMVYAMGRCLSVRLSVCHMLIFWGIPTILVFPYQTGWQYSDGDTLTGASNAWGV